MKSPLVSSLQALRYICCLLAAIASASLLRADIVPFPGGQVSIAYDYTFTTTPPQENVASYQASALPGGLSLNATSGKISGVPTTAGVTIAIFTIIYTNNESANIDFSITIAPAADTPAITSSLTASGTVAEAFTYTLTASNDPTSFNVDEAALPPGVTRSGATLSGTPSQSGSFNVEVSANNANGAGAASTLVITIAPAGEVPAITSAASLSSDANVQASYQITATNTPTSYSANGLPLGLALDSETGFISGTPTIEGTYAVSLIATNGFGASTVFTLTITIGDVPQITNELTLSLTQGEAMDAFALSASNNPTSFAVSGLPAGLSYSSSTKSISGTPTTVGASNVAIRAANGVGDGPSATLVITVLAAEEPLLEYRPATFSSATINGEFVLYLHFDQSAADLSVYNYSVETSPDLASWTSLDLADALLAAEIVDNEDGSKSVKIKYPSTTDASAPRFVRYRVTLKP